MFKKRFTRAIIALTLALAGLVIPFGQCVYANTNYEKLSLEGGGRVEFFDESALKIEPASNITRDVRVGSRILELLFGKGDEGERLLIPGGDVFGAKMKQKYVTVVESESLPTVMPGDRICEINGKVCGSVSDVRRLLSESGGSSVTLRVRGPSGERLVEVIPRLSDGEYRLGLTLRDTAAGIGTVTFIDPMTGAFGGLGHGICDGESGEVIEMQGGDVTGVILGGVHKGEGGKPGELCGVLTDEDIGDLTLNNGCGVFGVVENPKKLNTGAAIPIGRRSDVHLGEATIISTIKNGKRAEYKIEITEIDRTSDGSKSFRIRVTDPTLIALTGGIVRGMSGSPIIQDGKLVGAVTHVMVADPTEGYGIFIENMLNAAENTVPKAA